MKKIIALLFLGLSISFSKGEAQSLSDNQKYQNRKNILKASLTSLAFRNYHFQYERVINKTISLSINYSFVPDGDLPLLDTFDSSIDDEETIETLRGISYQYTSFTPEIRFYLSKKGYGKGFYLAPFYRNTKHTINNLAFEYDTDEGGVADVLTTGEVTSNSFGLLIGSQFNLGQRFVLDWWIAGPHFGSNTANFNDVTTDSLSEAEQESVRQTIEDFEIDLFDIESEVDENSVALNVDGPWFGLRAGFSFGFRF